MSADLKRARKLAQECRRTMFCDQVQSRLADALKTLDAELTQRESLCRELLEALRHIEGAAMDITVERKAIALAASNAIAKATSKEATHG